MAKVKNKRNSGLADKVNSKRKGEVIKKKLNPFEVHINREKLKVLGKKSKHDRGLPGVSRAKAIQKRKETLGMELKIMNKTNTFIDRRIGEKNEKLSAEDRMIARFAAERARQHGKKDIYNLADDEILTHRGQTLEQIEKFDDPRSSDDEDDDGRKGSGGLGDDFVSEGHFGGGMLSKTDSKDGAKSHKDLIEQLIAESKKRKAEKQKDKEQTLDLTEKLDSEWKDLQPVVFKKAKIEEKKEESLIDKLLSQAEKKSQDYDKMMRELKFEKRGTPSDGLKSDEKQAKEEKERLEKLELERQQRMLGEEDVVEVRQPVGKHRSADDLDDNFDLEDDKEYMLSYDKDGNPLLPEHILKDKFVPKSNHKLEDGISDSSSDDEDADDDDNDDDDSGDEEEEDDEETSQIETGTVRICKDIESKDTKEENDDDSGDEEDREDRNTHNESKTRKKGKDIKKKDPKKENLVNDSVLKEDDTLQNDKDDSVKSDGINESEEIEEKASDGNYDSNNLEDLKESDDESGSEQLDDNAEEEEQIDNTVFDIEEFNLRETLEGKTPSKQSIAIQKLIKSLDPSLAENNKDKLGKLFQSMLQYINDIFKNIKDEDEIIKSFVVFDKIAPHFYDLAHTNKVSSKKYLADVLKSKHGTFRKNPRNVPDLDTLIFFKLVSLLYPTSDFRHPITTPSLIFMMEILTLSKFKDARTISRGLFITALILEYTSLSKRYVPSAINFLRGVLYLASNTAVLNPIQVVPPFRLHKNAKLLNLEEDCSELEIGNKMVAKDLVITEIDDSFKIRSVLTSTIMLKEFFNNCNEMEAQECIFEPHLKLLDRIDLDLYPKKVASIISEIIQYMKASLEVKTYTPLCREKKRPKALRLYEPDFQDVFTGSKSTKLSRENAEKKRLEHKYKREMKGALREIRRDKAYIANVKMKQKIRSDNVRKEKVKQIYKEAAVQQGELNKLKRMK